MQDQLLKSVKGELVMIYSHSSTTIILPCPELRLYQVKKYTLNLTLVDGAEMVRPSRHSISGPRPTTWSRTRKHDKNLVPKKTMQQAPESDGAGPSGSHQQRKSSRSQHPSASIYSILTHS
jgi:hypothetical protein